MSSINVEQLEVGKHFKVTNGHSTLTIHSSPHTLGVWLSQKGRANSDQISMVADKQQIYFACYPRKGEFKNNLPFAFGPGGLQCPSADRDSFHRLSLEQVARIVGRLASEETAKQESSTAREDRLSGLVESYIKSLSWPEDMDEGAKDLAELNIRVFAAFLERIQTD